MKKKIKILFFLVFLILFSASTYAIYRVLMDWTLKNFNKSMAHEATGTVLEAFNRRLETIENLNTDWSSWDDSYQFVQDLNNAYIESNLQEESLQTANLNLILYFDETGYIVYKKAASLGGVGDTTVPGEVFNYTTVSGKINIPEIIKSGEQESGLLYTTVGTFLYSVSPILTSAGEGPATGALMMARYVNDSDVRELKKSTGYDLSLIDPTEVQRLYEGVRLEDLEKDAVIQEKNNMLSVFVLARDSWENPAKVINIRYNMVGFEDGYKLIAIMNFISAILATAFALSWGKIMVLNDTQKPYYKKGGSEKS